MSPPTAQRARTGAAVIAMFLAAGCADAEPDSEGPAANPLTTTGGDASATGEPMATDSSGSEPTAGSVSTTSTGTTGASQSAGSSSAATEESTGSQPDKPIEGGWQTSFDYPQECSQRGNLGNADCGLVADDGVYWNWGAKTQGGHSTQAVADANYPNGAGGLGFRSWVGDGENIQTGEARIDFDGPQTELWIRWYQRYQAGFAWQGGAPYYDKTLYIRSEGVSSVLPQHGAIPQVFSMTAQGSPDEYQAVAGNGINWNDVFGTPSDGEWRLFEIHIRMDAAGAPGLAQMWIEGELVIDVDTMDYSGGDPVSREGWTWLEFHSNQFAPLNGDFAYVDYDDMAIFTSEPPREDSAGNPWIGPVN